MSEREQTGPGLEPVEVLAEAMANPIRYLIMQAIAESPGLTIRQIAERVEEPSRRVRYQLDMLRGQGLVEISSQESRRGAIEHRYSMTRQLLVSGDEYDSLATDLKNRVALEVFRQVVVDVSVALRSGTFGVRPGHAAIRCVGRVDAAGWEALADLSIQFLEDTRQVIERAEQRIEESGEAGIPVTAGLALFEKPDLPDPARRDQAEGGTAGGRGGPDSVYRI
jgi:DNA-binding transcriptional ArsR family regulator